MSTIQTPAIKNKIKIFNSPFITATTYFAFCIIAISSNFYITNYLFYGYIPLILWLLLKKDISILPLSLLALFPFVINFSFNFHLFYPLNTCLIPIILSVFIIKKKMIKQIFTNTKFNSYFYLESLIAVILTSIVLFLWYEVYGSDLSSYFKILASSKTLVLTSSILLFSIINAIIEEVAFRGVIQTILIKKFSNLKVYGIAIAILLQGFWFGASHYQNGFPCYISGFLLASLYGVFLGLLKHRTENLYLCILTHIFADITICILLIFL